MNQGFTFIECLIVIALMLLLFGLTVPAYQQLSARQAAEKHIDALASALHFARSTAVAYHTTVTICKSNNGLNCGGNWRDGWLVFFDKNATGQVTSKTNILRVYPALPEKENLVWRSNGKNKSYLQFTADGSTHGQTGSFIYSQVKPEIKSGYEIIVSLTGRIRLEKYGCVEICA